MNAILKAAARAAILAFLAAGTTGAAQALSLVDGAQPAEYPPAGYGADIYVDSRGCIYIRAGYGDTTTWVPRVTRDRQVVCGARPSLAAGTARTAAVAPPAPAPARTPVPTPAPAPMPAPTPVAAPAPAAPALQPISRTVTLTCPAGGADKQVRADGATVILRCQADQRRTISYVVRTSSGERIKVIVEPPARAPVQVATVVVSAPDAPASVSGGASACPGRTGISRAYTNASGVRCGPQQQPAVSYSGTTTGTAAGPAPVTRQVAVAPPPGYRVAWQDGRLNPNRGPQGGQAAAAAGGGAAGWELMWTRSVPYKLYDVTTGRDVTALFPGIHYPDMPSAAQIAAAAGGRRVVVGSSSAAPAVAAPVTPGYARAPVPSVTRVAAVPPTPAATAGMRYVQVAMFGVPANTRRTVARLEAMGLKVRVSAITRGGKRFDLVMAGPYADRSALMAALGQVRGAGFGDAYLRR